MYFSVFHSFLVSVFHFTSSLFTVQAHSGAGWWLLWGFFEKPVRNSHHQVTSVVSVQFAKSFQSMQTHIYISVVCFKGVLLCRRSYNISSPVLPTGRTRPVNGKGGEAVKGRCIFLQVDLNKQLFLQ